MIAKEEVDQFLRQMKEKIAVFDVVFRYRDKNLAALVELDITPTARKACLLQLAAEDYYSGPNKDTYDASLPDYYEFGIALKKSTVYIKISLGKVNKPVDCLSFHLAEFPITYPLKHKKL